METEKDPESCRWEVCRLCASKERDGSLLFAPTECDQSTDLATLINKYLPLKVENDGKYPRTICPGCHIQLEATVQFMETVIAGQKKLKEIYNNSSNLHNTNTLLLSNNTSLIQDDELIYASDHNVTMQLEDLDKPKKKRGRPKKEANSTSLTDNAELSIPEPNIPVENEKEATDGKRKRYAPRRFGEQLQGKELDKVFQDVGIDDTDIDSHGKSLFDDPEKNKEIGILKHPDGEITTVNQFTKKNKGRYSSERSCKICSMKFFSLKPYMAHVALHQIPQIMPLEPMDNLDLPTQEQIAEITATPILDTLSLNDPSIDINLENYNVAYFTNAPSMPDIASETEANKNLDSSASLLLEHTSSNLFSDSNIHDPVAEMITSSIMPIATMPPGEMNKKEAPPVKEPEIIVSAESKPKTQCSECGKMFNSIQACNIHTKIVHKGERPFKCQQCGRSFGHAATLNKHTLTHFPKLTRAFACDICGKVLKHPSSVLYHKDAEHNDGKEFLCKLCNKSFKHRQLLVRHQLVHMEDRPYSCKICNASFKSKSTLGKHEKTHNGVKQYQCEICNKLIAHKSSLNIHMKTHKGIKPYKCTVCEKSFSQSGNLKEHMRTHTGEKPFTCETCNKTFSVSSQYQIHLQSHQEQDSLMCKECGKQFFYKESFKIHSKRHKNEKAFSCACGKSFIDRWSLRKHNRVHTGEKPHTCDICEKSFSDSSNLLKHRKIHGTREQTITMDNTFDNQILHVTYGNENEPPMIHMPDESEVNVINTCELYGTENQILDNDNGSMNDTTAVMEVPNVNILDGFVDEEGNPISFEEHGIVTISTDGKYLSQLQNDVYQVLY